MEASPSPATQRESQAWCFEAALCCGWIKRISWKEATDMHVTGNWLARRWSQPNTARFQVDSHFHAQRRKRKERTLFVCFGYTLSSCWIYRYVKVSLRQDLHKLTLHTVWLPLYTPHVLLTKLWPYGYVSRCHQLGWPFKLGLAHQALRETM